MKRKHLTLSERATRATQDAGPGGSGWEKPSHECTPEELATRLRLAWLNGYSAAQRDASNRVASEVFLKAVRRLERLGVVVRWTMKRP